MRQLFTFITAIVWFTPLTAQFSGISTTWSDSFVEWDIFAFDSNAPVDSTEAPEEYKVGSFKLRWLAMKEDWSEWDFELGEQSGVIKLKWKTDPSNWELRTYGGEIITLRTAWPGDYTEWKVSDGNRQLTIKSRYTSQLDEWLVDDRRLGRFRIKAFSAYDPRDWQIEDELDDAISPAMRLALMFIAVFQASPKR